MASFSSVIRTCKMKIMLLLYYFDHMKFLVLRQRVGSVEHALAGTNDLWSPIYGLDSWYLKST